MKLILIRSPQLLFYKIKSKEKIRTRRRIKLQCQREGYITKRKATRKLLIVIKEKMPY